MYVYVRGVQICVLIWVCKIKYTEPGVQQNTNSSCPAEKKRNSGLDYTHYMYLGMNLVRFLAAFTILLWLDLSSYYQ